MGGNVRGHHGAGADHCPLPYLVAAHDGSISTDGGTGAHGRLEVVGGALGVLRARGEVVREDAGRSAEDPVAELDALVDGDVVLDLHAVPDDDAVGDVHVLAEAATLADPSAGLNVAEMPHLGAVADGGAIVDDGSGMHERRH